MEDNVDIAVQWDDNTINIVSKSEIKALDDEIAVGKRIKMWWKPNRRWWYGTVTEIATAEPQVHDTTDVLQEEEEEADPADDSVNDPDYQPDSERESDGEHPCEAFNCSRDVFAACVDPNCQRLLCYDHFVGSCPFCPPEVMQNPHGSPPPANLQPEDFNVEGAEKEHINENTQPNQNPPNKSDRKRLRNSGTAYVTEKSKRVIPARRQLKARCNGGICDKRGLQCTNISDECRQSIIDSFYDLGNLTKQREWIRAHISATEPSYARKDKSRKGRTILYHLPGTENERLPVCRVLFLKTLGINDRQVRTVLSKTTDTGVMEKEMRGGRCEVQSESHRLRLAAVNSHIDRFPRTESHYCRRSSTCEYLAAELTVDKMYRMFLEENPQDSVSFSTYYSAFKRKNLKFFKPKKDLCSICESYRQGDEEAKIRLQERFEQHVAEKNKVREIKDNLKSAAEVNKNSLVATFDLEQVIYLPKSNRCEIFYKRRLSCYNFTVFELNSRKADCYVWHEGIGGRGANEIASNLVHYLENVDSSEQGISTVSLFADGCGGQNKNSIVVTALLNFVRRAKNVEEVTLFFYATNHGQCEGDSVHSVIERVFKRSPEIMVPSQLVTLIRMARKTPYQVFQLSTSDILDWKELSLDIGILRERVAEDGTMISWPKVMQVRVNKSEPNAVFFKLSHLSPNFHRLNLNTVRRSSTTSCMLTTPGQAYLQPPKLSVEKYRDLMTLCAGDTPVIHHPEHVAFYTTQLGH